jgi:hypothetical protein
MRANRRAGVTKLIDAFRDFANARKFGVCVCGPTGLLNCTPLVILHAVECGLWHYAQQAPEFCSTPPTVAHRATYPSTRPQSRPLWCKYTAAEVAKWSVASLTRRAHWLWT